MVEHLRRALFNLVVIAGATAALVLAAASPGRAAAGKITVTWLGHATFEVVSPAGTRLLIDPFIKPNPKTPEKLKDLSLYEPDAILVSHSHPDHTADVVEIATRSKAKVIGVGDHLRSLELPKELVMGGNPGGKIAVGDVTVHFVPAMHSSAPGGRPLGYVLRFADGRSLYFTGDTWIFGDMALIQEIFAPSIILLQAGGGPFNQDPEIAALAIEKYFEPEVIIPMHYGTWPVLSGEDEVRKAFGSDPRARIMTPGETKEF